MMKTSKASKKIIMVIAEFQPTIQAALSFIPLVPILFGMVHLKWSKDKVKQVVQVHLSGESTPVENTGEHTIDESQILGTGFSLYTDPSQREGFTCTIVPRKDPKGVRISIVPALGGRVAAHEKKAVFLTNDSVVATHEAIDLEVKYKP